ncbi:MAG: hypothetical protein RMK18_00900 [Armatimonadota bacterium]|nr:hypothetical protein [Armatimonadota bacterium]MCX7776901.1 hypothetical protein [Armatimonadota bacterium]MDW8024413.1 hypothetical protein [Armatimonadota bacterium]
MKSVISCWLTFRSFSTAWAIPPRWMEFFSATVTTPPQLRTAIRAYIVVASYHLPAAWAGIAAHEFNCPADLLKQPYKWHTYAARKAVAMPSVMMPMAHRPSPPAER